MNDIDDCRPEFLSAGGQCAACQTCRVGSQSMLLGYRRKNSIGGLARPPNVEVPANIGLRQMQNRPINPLARRADLFKPEASQSNWLRWTPCLNPFTITPFLLLNPTNHSFFTKILSGPRRITNKLWHSIKLNDDASTNNILPIIDTVQYRYILQY